MAPLPAGIRGHFGPELRRYVLMQYHQGQVTVERLVAQLQAIGISICKRQVMRLLIAGQDDFLAETREVLRVGLQTAPWVTVDDTGARHRGANGVCTQIGDDRFTWFGTTGSKSRLNFLELLRAGHTDYVVNPAALEYMREHALAGPVIQRLQAHPQRQFADQAAWLRHLEHLGLTGLPVTPDPVRVATEGALWGAVAEHGFLHEAIIVTAAPRPWSAHASGRCLDVPNASHTNGTQVQLWDCNGQTEPAVDLHRGQAAEGVRQQVPRRHRPGTANGTAVIIWDCNGQTNQQWNVNANGTITGVQSGCCLDVWGTANGTKIQLYDCHGQTNQQWNRR